MTTWVRPYGDSALLAEVDDPRSVLALTRFARDLLGVEAAVPAARTVLVRLGRDGLTPERRQQAASALLGFDGVTPAEVSGRHHRIAVHYDGADLAGVATVTGLSVEDVIAAHAGTEFTVAFCGFAPGFAYLSGLPAELQVPRLGAPRTRVPAGSVAIAAEFSAVYPRSSPGGWRLLGHTDETMWDTAAVPPARLEPGDTVTFEPV